MSKKEALRKIKEAAETGATELDLSRQGLTEFPPEIVQLTKIERLYLDDNQLTSLPPEIAQLTNLTALDIGGNQLNILLPELFQLKNLTSLNLYGNQLTALPPEIVHLTKLKRFALRGNPLVAPPLELAYQGIEAIREYFAEVEGETKEVAEVKVILMGDGASGKTSLIKQLHGKRFDPQEKITYGIRIEDLTLAGASRSISCKLWDFGGQEIMHATHQFFLSHRSLYVLVLDGRQDNKAEYWLRYIESFGGGSPVLVVLNKYDVHPSFDLNRPFIKEKYPFIVGFYRTSCNTGNGIEDFKQALLEEVNKALMTKNRWPVSWFRAKELLEKMKEPRISYERFEGICIEAGVKGKTTRKVLSAFLHDLGRVIHFEDFDLDDNYVLAPKWVTGAVYKIINAPLIAEAKGLLKLCDLREIFQWKEGDDYRYYPGDYVFIIELMKKFELCYELNHNEVLIPDLLNVPQPSFEVNDKDALRFLLHYEDFLPPSIMPRFIVKRHHEIKDSLRWRSGVVLENPMLDATAVVQEDNEARRIQIMVTGKDSKLFLALICLTFRELHADFEGLKVSERVPLPEQPSISVAYESLLKSQEAGIEKVFPEGAKKAYNVRELLNGVYIESAGDQEKVLAMVKTDSKDGGLRLLAKKLNRYVEGNLELFGLKINYQNVIEDVLNRPEK